MELFIWRCVGCGIRVQTLFDLHVNQRPICVECNIEMGPDDRPICKKCSEPINDEMGHMCPTPADPCPVCGAGLLPGTGGGVKCSECPYWFCY